MKESLALMFKELQLPAEALLKYQVRVYARRVGVFSPCHLMFASVRLCFQSKVQVVRLRERVGVNACGRVKKKKE